MLNVLLGESSDNLKNLLDFYLPDGGSICDITYGIGSLVSKLEVDRWKVVGCDSAGSPANFKCDWGFLPFSEQTFDVVVFDPPYLISRESKKMYQRKNLKWAARHSKTQEILDYFPPVSEGYRVLKFGGLFVSKIQNCRVKGVLIENDVRLRQAIQTAGFSLREVWVYLRLNTGTFKNKRTPQQAYGFFIVGEKDD